MTLVRISDYPTGESWRLLEVTNPKTKSIQKVLAKIAVSSGDLPGVKIELFSIGATITSTPIGSFGARLHTPANDETRVYQITGGKMRLERDWQGLHLGTWCQNLAVAWVLSQPAGGVASIKLAPVDAIKGDDDNAKDDKEKRERRNAFYSRYGIEFAWATHEIEGHSLPMSTRQLIQQAAPLNIKELSMVDAIHGLQLDVEGLARDIAALESKNSSLRDERQRLRRMIRSLWLGCTALVIGVLVLAAALYGRSSGTPAAGMPDQEEAATLASIIIRPVVAPVSP